jgi:hypothetical protein
MTKKPSARGSADNARSREIKDRTMPAAISLSTPAQRPFDAWLERELRGLFDEVASEPLPTDLMAIVQGRKPADPKP